MKIEGSRLWWIETLTQTLFAACQLRLRFAVGGSELPVADLDRSHQNTELDFQDQQDMLLREGTGVDKTGHERYDILI